jgi:PilZ domain
MGVFPMNTTTEQPDRRGAKRLSIERDVQYRLLTRRDGEPEGAGKTLNMSSSGVLFTTDQTLLPGRRMELTISWPAHLDNKCALKLVARGRVVRFEGTAAALEIMQHEFRTKSSKS